MDNRSRLRRFSPRHRFRNRLLAGMVAVSVIPLAVFAVVVAADLGSVTRTTVDATNQSILRDQEDVQQRQVADNVAPLQQKLTAAAAQLRTLRDRAADLIARAGPSRGPAQVVNVGGLQVINRIGTDYTLLGGIPTAAPLVNTARLLADEGVLSPLATDMDTARKTDPDIQYAWVADTQDTVVVTDPAIPDVAAAVARGSISPANLLGRGGQAFAAYQRDAGAATLATAAADGNRPGLPRAGDPMWTDTYIASRSGDEGITVWVDVSIGGPSRYRVGIDLGVRQLTSGIAQMGLGQAASYPFLVSSSGLYLAGDAAVAHDFSGATAGAPLPDAGTGLRDQMAAIEQNGHAQALRVRLKGEDKEIFTAQVLPARWTLAVAVPTRDLLPLQGGLVRGIDSGVRRILAAVVPLTIVLCALAFLLSTLLARRLVAPVGALTRAAERLAEGHTGEAVPAQGVDEVGKLAESLERMRREVNSSRHAILAAAHELEQRVTDRTVELRDRNEELVALNALAASLTRSLDPSTLLGDALETMRAVLPLRAGRGYLIDGGRPRRLTDWAGEQLDPAVARDLDTIAAAAVDDREMVPRVQASGTLLGLPLETADGTQGVMAVLATAGWQPSGRTRALLRAIADQVGLALRTAQLSAEGRELAVLEERTRLAREIHDTLAQQLTAIVLQLEAAEAFIGRDQERARAVVVAARDTSRSALQEARRSVWNLRPAPLDATGLVAAVQREVARWRQRTGIAATVRTRGLTPAMNVDPQAEVALFRVLQEALANVARHSGAESVEVLLVHADGVLSMSVTDDGVGLDPGRMARSGAFGLVGMAERARLVGAGLSVEPASERGTRVEITLPLPDAGSMAASA